MTFPLTAGRVHRYRCSQYPKIILSALFSSVLLSAVFNSLVDPLRMIGAPWRIDSIDAYREIEQNTRAGKSGMIRSHRDVEVALIGSSRIAIGMRAEDPAWRGAKTLNLGMPYALLTESIPMLDYLLKNETRLDWVVLNLDLGDLSSPVDNREMADFYDSPLAGSLSLENRLRYLLGTSGIFACMETLNRHKAGAITEFNTSGDWIGWQVSRPRERLAQSLPEYHTPFDGKYHTGPEEGMCMPKLDALRSSLANCLERGIRVSLIAMPTHAMTFSWLGEGPAPGAPWQFERRAIVGLVNDLQQKHPGARIEWWDFVVFHPLTTERFAAAGEGHEDTAEHPLYWMDHAHPNPLLSSIIAARIAGTPVPEHPGQPFGRMVGPADIDSFLAELVTGDAAFREANPNEIAWAREELGKQQ